jgi:hypothetical protein
LYSLAEEAAAVAEVLLLLPLREVLLLLEVPLKSPRRSQRLKKLMLLISICLILIIKIILCKKNLKNL